MQPEKTQITLYQLYCLMLLLGLGSSSILGLGLTAQQDAWIAILLSTGVGVILFLMYGYIFINNSDKVYTEILESVFGKVMGKILTVVYLFYFLIIGSLVLRDMDELICMYLLPGTPPIVTSLSIAFVTVYTISFGIETIARASEIQFATYILLFIIMIFLIIASGIIDLTSLLPILEKGPIPVLKASQVIISFPFGELIIFLMFLPFINNKGKAIKVGIFSVISVGLILSIITILNITVLGVFLSENTIFPTLKTIRMIDIGGFVQRLDAFAVVFILIGGLIKLILYMYAVTLGLNSLVNIKKSKKVIITVGLLIVILSRTLSSNLTTHIYVGLNVEPFVLGYPLEIVIPFILMVVVFIRKKLKHY